MLSVSSTGRGPGEPPWGRCLHLAAGTCPVLALEGMELAGAGPRAELSQELALMRLARACAECALAPEEER